MDDDQLDDQLIARYLATLAAEREAWGAVKGCLPGSSDYDAVKWQGWRQAVRASDEARRALPCLSGFTGGPPAGTVQAAKCTGAFVRGDELSAASGQRLTA